MAVLLSDNYWLSTDQTFQHRVQSSLVATCIAVANEGNTTNQHTARMRLINQILNGNPTSLTNWVQLFAISVATDTNCINDATGSGATNLTSGNVAAQAALVTDAHISSAISGQFNTFIQPI
jgi:hypothetical protein